MKVVFKNSMTGELKEVKVGFSWTLFFFSSVFGIPLFLRKLSIWGGVMAALWLVYFLEEGVIAIFIYLIICWLAIFFAVKGNEMTAKNYLKNGWNFVEPESDNVRAAKQLWGITV